MKKNVLFITCDQLRKDALGVYGNMVVRTPHIDELFKDAAVFHNMYCASPVCAPNRGAIATGKWPTVNGLVFNGYLLPRDSMTMPEAFRKNGYRTYGIGKMHFEGQWEFGFDSVTGAGGLNPQPREQELPLFGFETCHFTEDSRVGPYADYLAEHGYDTWKEPHSCDLQTSRYVGPSTIPEEFSQTHWITDQALEELRRHQKEETNQPFFMWLSYVDPHHPFNPPARYLSMYPPEKMPLPVYREGENENRPDAVRMNAFGWCKNVKDSEWGGGWDFDPSDMKDEEWQKIKAAYYAMITQIDDNIGRVVEQLKESGEYDNTIFVFTADHGEILGDHHMMMKGYDFDCVSNVPFMVKLPEMTQRKDVDILCQSLEIMPTVLDLAHIAVPSGLNGKSMRRQIEGQPEEFRKFIHINQEACGRGYTGWVSVRSKKYRMTVYPAETCKKSDMLGELYDLEKDPNSFENLWYRREYQTIKEQLIAELVMQLKEEYSAEFQAKYCV